MQADRLRLTREGIFVSDGIISDLMFIVNSKTGRLHDRTRSQTLLAPNEGRRLGTGFPQFLQSVLRPLVPYCLLFREARRMGARNCARRLHEALGTTRPVAGSEQHRGLLLYPYQKCLPQLPGKREPAPYTLVRTASRSFRQADSPEDTLISEELFARYVKALDRLPERCRKVFIRLREEKQSYAQVAEELNISTKTVDAQLQKALTRLKEALLTE